MIVAPVALLSHMAEKRNLKATEKVVAHNQWVNHTLTVQFLPPPTMKHLSPHHKHSILLEYRPYSRDHSFAALAARHGVTGGKRVVKRWHSHWNGTVASLDEQPHPGRPRILSTQEVQRYIAPRIGAKNRSAQCSAGALHRHPASGGGNYRQIDVTSLVATLRRGGSRSTSGTGTGQEENSR